MKSAKKPDAVVLDFLIPKEGEEEEPAAPVEEAGTDQDALIDEIQAKLEQLRGMSGGF